MAEFHVKRGRLISSTVTVPGDRSISHRAVLVAALSNGPCVIEGFLPVEDTLATVKACQALGVRIDLPREDDEDEPKVTGKSKKEAPPALQHIRIVVHGRKGLFTEPTEPVDCGGSGSTLRLISGLLVAQPFRSELHVNDSLGRRPHRRTLEPLLAMGADISATGDNSCPPFVINGRALEPVHYTLPISSAQNKSAMLFAGLLARGKTTVVEPVQSRDHTERMLNYFRVKLLREPSDDGRGLSISIYGGQVPESQDIRIPGDVSSAAPWIVAAAAQPGSELHVVNVGLNPTRTGFLRVLTRMGAHISEVIENSDMGEPRGRIVIRGTELRGTVIEGSEIDAVIDELPCLALAGALARGKTTIKDAHELRVKDTDRIAAMSNNLRAMGVTVRELYDGMEIEGGAALKGARITSFGDHRIALAFAVAGLFAEGETIVDTAECVDKVYPGFAAELKRFQSRGISEDIVVPVISALPRKDDKKRRGLFSLPSFGSKKKAAAAAAAAAAAIPDTTHDDRTAWNDALGPNFSTGAAPAPMASSTPLFSEGRDEVEAPVDDAAFGSYLKTGVASDLDRLVVTAQDLSPTGTVIAIDGPAASGKSSVAKRIAEALGFVHVNSGAMYRAVTWAALSTGTSPGDHEAVAALLPRLDLDCGIADGRSTLTVNGVDPTAYLSHEAVNGAVSAISQVAEVRDRLVALQRDYALVANVVMEGRDIGSVVFPDTRFKYYIDARPDVRAQRRAAQGLTDEVTARDAQDSQRAVSPLMVPDGATLIDSSDLTLDQVVDAVIDDLRAKGVVEG
jgi:3-phosphoshikimate 1-carboxyvinyltransferase